MPAYFLIWPLIMAVAHLPRRIMYWFSDFLFFIVYRIVAYRLHVVRKNLRLAFPLKSSKELKTIEKEFYAHLCDMVVETLRLLTLSPQEVNDFCVFKRNEALEQLYTSGKPFIFVLGHTGNWELTAPAFSVSEPVPLYALYKPLSNERFNRLIVKARTRLGTRLIPMHDTLRRMAELRNRACAVAFIADQSPAPENAVWLPFFGQTTAVYAGPEKIARKMNMPVVYAGISKVARGKYEINCRTITLDPAQLPTNAVMHTFLQLLEEDIRHQPACWLWSHDRWKHRVSPKRAQQSAQ